MTSGEGGLNATATSTATSNDGGFAAAGNDLIWGGEELVYGGFYGNDTIAGDALTYGDGNTALANNDAIVNDLGGSASAGDDTISAADGNHALGGDAVVLGNNSMAAAQNTADGAGASAGDGDIEVGKSRDSASDDDLPQNTAP